MVPEYQTYEKDVIYDNRQRIEMLSLLGFFIGIASLLAIFFGIPGLEPPPSIQWVWAVFTMAGSAVAWGYSAYFKRKPVMNTVENIHQFLLSAMFTGMGVAYTLLYLPVTATLNGYLISVLLTGLFLRNSLFKILIIQALALVIITLAFSLSNVQMDASQIFQLLMFGVLGVAITVSRESDRRDRFNAQLQLLDQSIIDPLTDVYNRRFFIEELERSVQRRKRYGNPFCLAVIDIDKFRELNEEHGHLVGDSVLETYAWMLLDHLRESDVVSRYAADEFMIILSETRIDESRLVLERVRSHFASYEFHGIGKPLSCSIAVLESEQDADTNKMLQDADELIQKAKAEGGNRTIS